MRFFYILIVSGVVLSVSHVQPLWAQSAKTDTSDVMAQTATLPLKHIADKGDASEATPVFQETSTLQPSTPTDLRHIIAGLKNELTDRRTALEEFKAEQAVLRSRMAAQTRDVRAELAALSTELSRLKGELEAAEEARAIAKSETIERQTSLKDLGTAIGQEKARLHDAVAALDEAVTRRAEIETSISTLKTHEAARHAEITAMRDTREDLERRISAGRDALRLLTRERRDLGRDIRGVQGMFETETRQLAKLQAQIAALDTPAATPEPVFAEPVALATTQMMPPSLLQPRTAAQVAVALRAAPGLPRHDATRMQDLSTQLITGACVADAMAGSLNEINRQALRSLIGTLGGC